MITRDTRFQTYKYHTLKKTFTDVTRTVGNTPKEEKHALWPSFTPKCHFSVNRLRKHTKHQKHVPLQTREHAWAGMSGTLRLSSRGSRGTLRPEALNLEAWITCSGPRLSTLLASLRRDGVVARAYDSNSLIKARRHISDKTLHLPNTLNVYSTFHSPSCCQTGSTVPARNRS
jgi:hypothetical protein